MSFTAEIKRELVRTAPSTRTETLALLRAVLLTSGRLDADGFSFTGENETVAAYLLEAVDLCFHAQMTLTEAVRDPKHGLDKLTFSLSGEGALFCAREIASAPLREEDCALAYLKGAFLGGGSCTLPRGGAKTGYHLEFVFENRREAEDFTELLDRFQLFGGVVPRGERFVVYCKSREGIADFLSVVGAQSALKTLAQVSAAREESNLRNRVENCTAGNIDRSLTASAKQVRVLLAARGKLDALPAPLKETALARIENPTLSLGELAALLNVSKGGLNHRMRRLMELFGETE